MNIRTKLLFTFLSIAALVMIVGIISIQTSRNTDRDFELVVNQGAPALIALGEIRAASNRAFQESVSVALIQAEVQFVDEDETEELEEIAEEIAEETEEFEESFVRIDALISQYEAASLSPNAAMFGKDLREAATIIVNSGQMLIDLKQQGDTGEAIIEQKEDLEATEDRFLETIQAATDAETTIFREARNTAERSATVAIIVDSIAIIIAVLLAAALGLIIASNISRPIIALKDAAVQVGQGNLDVQVENRATDEVGVLTQNFNQMVVDLKETTVSRTYVDNIIQSMFDSLIVITPDRVIRTVNQATLTFLQYEEQELIGQSIDIILGDVLAKALKDGNFRNSDLNDSTEQIYIQKNGNKVPVLFSISPLPDIRDGYVCVARDIRDQKRFEEELIKAKEGAEAANKAKSTFLANMSHELRTPLNAILGFSEMLMRNNAVSTEYRENVNIIYRSGEHLLTLINNVLDLSKIEAGRMKLVEKNFDLYHLLTDTEDLFQLKAKEKQLQLIFEQSPNIPQFIRTDEVKLRQVLINLIGNALKFTQEGGVVLRVSLMDNNNQLLERRTLYFEIEDTGSGIAAEEIPKLFEPFSQTRSGQTSEEGTGLGVSISHEFISLMGGQLTVDSQVGQGSIFKFDIQIEEVNADEITQKQSRRRITALEPGHPIYRILVVDDRDSNRQLMVKLLESLNFEVQEAVNGQEAFERWQQWQPHLIWMDMRMPVLDGYEATQRIREESGDDNSPIIIALTASSLDEERQVVMDAGCDDFLRKPFREMTMFDMMSKHLGLRYIYEQGDTSSPLDSQDIEQILTPSSLTALPIELLTNLERATAETNLSQILSHIETVKMHDAQIAQALTTLAKDFEYEKILTLIRAVKN